MATFKICVFEHQKREDDKFPVSIRVYWNKKSAYISTEYYVYAEQIYHNKRKKVFELRDTAIISELTDRIKMYDKAKVDRLGLSIYNYSASELARFFEDLHDKKDDEIDFIKFARDYEKRVNRGRLRTTLNALEDFTGDLPVHELTSKFLKRFEDYLKTKREITRINQLGKTVTTINKPVSDSTVADYMGEIRAVFNIMLLEFNDEEKGIVKIAHNPFKLYKLPKVPATAKRNINPRHIYKISRIPDRMLTERSILARDVFILSFMLIGMNLKDLYDLKKSSYANGRITYKRSKTKSKRKDEALISVKVEPEAIKYINKYLDSKDHLFIFHTMYSTSHGFASAVSKGLKRVAIIVGCDPELSSYYARHSWATIARNKCKISKSDVDECLNHVNQSENMADVYIEKDWSVVDDSNRKVLDHVFISCNLRKDFVKSVRSKSLKIVRKCTNKKSGSLL